jgi:nucleotide-binding universal stress UspA family protein
VNATPFVDSILHATDFSETSQRAFAHALAVALMRQTKFTLLHAGSDATSDSWTKFPAIRKTLERWGLLEAGSARAEVFDQLNVRAEKVLLRKRNAARAIADFVEAEEPDLLVLGTAGREGLPRWLHPSVAERAARWSGCMTLFVPEDARGFVSLEDGTTSLRRILIPVAAHPNADGALVRACRAAEALGDHPVAIDVLHVGDGPEPDLPLPEGEAWTCRRLQRSGDPVQEIVAAAAELEPDLLVMATAGHEGILDALRGSVTQQVLRLASCPLLAIPAGRAA